MDLVFELFVWYTLLVISWLMWVLFLVAFCFIKNENRGSRHNFF